MTGGGLGAATQEDAAVDHTSPVEQQWPAEHVSPEPQVPHSSGLPQLSVVAHTAPSDAHVVLGTHTGQAGHVKVPPQPSGSVWPHWLGRKNVPSEPPLLHDAAVAGTHAAGIVTVVATGVHPASPGWSHRLPFSVQATRDVVVPEATPVRMVTSGPRTAPAAPAV